MRGFHKIFAMDVADKGRSLLRTPSWSRPIWDLVDTLSKLYDVPDVFVTPSPILRLGIALLAVADGWLLLDNG